LESARIAAKRCDGQDAPRRHMDYFRGVLRENCWNRGGLETVAEVERRRSWFGALLAPLERIVDARMPAPPAPDEKPPKAEAQAAPRTCACLLEGTEIGRDVLARKRRLSPAARSGPHETVAGP
jgi:hypothetical protein